MSTLQLQASELACVRGQRVLFEGLSLQVQAGQALWVRGRNGSGKTSLLRLLCGLGTPAHGVVRWGGQDIRHAREDFQNHLLWIGHAGGLKDELSPSENLAFGARLAGQAPEAAALAQALGCMGLSQQSRLPAGLLSQGQRRRVALARLFLPNPPALWVLDEPFTALDAPTVALLVQRLQAHLAAGGLLVYTTHQPQTLVCGQAAQVLPVLDLDQLTTRLAPC